MSVCKVTDFVDRHYLVKLSEGGTEIARTVSFNVNKYTDVYGQQAAVTSTTAPAVQTVTETVGLKFTAPARQPTEMNGRLVFMGWYDNELTIGEPFDFTSKIMIDITLYAKWELRSVNSVYLLTPGMNTRSDLPRDSNGDNTLYWGKQSNGVWQPMTFAFRSFTTKTIQLIASTSVGGGLFYVTILDNKANTVNPLSTPWIINSFTGIEKSFTFEGGVLYHFYFTPYDPTVDDFDRSLYYQLSISGTRGELPNDGGISSGVVYLTDSPEKYGLGSSMVIFDQDMPTTKGPYGTYITPKLYPPIREGFTFMGYYTQMNGQGVKYYNADMTSAKKWDIDADTTLYAYWEP